jgi:hypothetical protein
MENIQTNTNRKKFGAYLLEGLMLFIAVTLGFIAENLRENIGDRKKEREYVSSLITNLKQDTIALRYAILENRRKMAGLDSLISLSDEKLTDSKTRQRLYKYSLHISFYSTFISNDATMMQLKNSGGLQLIKHGHVSDSVAFYDQVVRNIYAAEGPYGKALYDAQDAAEQVLAFRVFRDSTYFRSGIFTDKELPLLTTDPHQFEIFFNKVLSERGWTENYVKHLQDKLPYAVRLIELLEEEYEFE